MVAGHEGALGGLGRAPDGFICKNLPDGGLQLRAGICLAVRGQKKCGAIGFTGISVPNIFAVMQEQMPIPLLLKPKLGGPAKKVGKIRLVRKLCRLNCCGDDEEREKSCNTSQGFTSKRIRGARARSFHILEPRRLYEARLVRVKFHRGEYSLNVRDETGRQHVSVI